MDTLNTQRKGWVSRVSRDYVHKQNKTIMFSLKYNNRYSREENPDTQVKPY